MTTDERNEIQRLIVLFGNCGNPDDRVDVFNQIMARIDGLERSETDLAARLDDYADHVHDDTLSVYQLAERLREAAARLRELERDRDEWKTSNEYALELAAKNYDDLKRAEAESERHRLLWCKAASELADANDDNARLRAMVRDLCIGHPDACDCRFCKEVFRKGDDGTALHSPDGGPL